MRSSGVRVGQVKAKQVARPGQQWLPEVQPDFQRCVPGDFAQIQMDRTVRSGADLQFSRNDFAFSRVRCPGWIVSTKSPSAKSSLMTAAVIMMDAPHA